MILSIQSHVAFGHVGNRAALFPLERRGHEVIAVNTVQFSNHTGYGHWEGDVMTPDHIARVLAGVKERGLYKKIDALLTGYLGAADLGDLVLAVYKDILKERPDCLYLCDPVMGDTGRGFFASTAIQEFFKTRAVKNARIMTPNLFEIEALTDITCATRNDALRAASVLHKKGVEIVLLTSWRDPDMPRDTIGLLASSSTGDIAFANTSWLPLDPLPNGAGDLTAALFLSHILQKESLAGATEKTVRAVHAVFEKTLERKSRELAIVAAQDSLL